MANAVLLVLSMTIGLFFILMGLIKLTPAFNDDVYREMRKVFIRSAKVFPLAAQMGWKPNPHMFRRIVGTTEVVCGTLLAIVPGPIKEIANVILFGMMCGAVYIHYALKDGIEKMTPALVFGLLLGCRFVVHLQVKAREARQEREEKARQAKEGESRQATGVEDKKEQ